MRFSRRLRSGDEAGSGGVEHGLGRREAAVEIVGSVAGCPGCGEAAAEMVGMVDEVSQ